MQDSKEYIYLGHFREEELMVVKPLLEEAGLLYEERLVSEGQVLRLYTASAGALGAEIWVLASQLKEAKALLGLSDQ